MSSRNNGALVMFSGGQDSAVCLAHALTHFDHVETVGFDYGQRHQIELETRLVLLEAMRGLNPDWDQKLGIDHVCDLRGFGQVAWSSLTRETEIIMQEKGLPSTFVPGRNLVFFVYAAALADRRGIDHLIGGMCETDFSGYPDCRQNTMQAMQHVLRLGVERDYEIHTPLMYLTKAQTWDLALRLGGQELVDLIIKESHTCYLGNRTDFHEWGYGCATCPACTLRRDGFETFQKAQSRAKRL